MHTPFECFYGFDELEIYGIGMMAYGTATLVQDGEDGFYVETIVLDDGTRFDRRHGVGMCGSEFTKTLFARMAVAIEEDEKAQEYFNEKYAEDSSKSDDDYAYDAWKDRQMDDQWREAAE